MSLAHFSTFAYAQQPFVFTRVYSVRAFLLFVLLSSVPDSSLKRRACACAHKHKHTTASWLQRSLTRLTLTSVRNEAGPLRAERLARKQNPTSQAPAVRPAVPGAAILQRLRADAALYALRNGCKLCGAASRENELAPWRTSTTAYTTQLWAARGDKWRNANPSSKVPRRLTWSN